MIHLFVGFVAGAVAACISHFVFSKAKPAHEQKIEPTPEEARLNEEKKRRANWLKEQDRQFNNMMNYHGEEQVKA